MPEPESSEEVAHFLLAHFGRNASHMVERGAPRVELLDPVLGEVSDFRVPRVLDRPGTGCEPPRHPPQQGRLAHPVRPEQRDPVSGRQDHRDCAQHRVVAVSECRALERRYRPRGSLGFEEFDAEPLLRGERLHHLHPLQRLEPALRLPCFGGLVAESIDECLHSLPLAPKTFARAPRMLDLGRAQPFERAVVSGVDADPAVTDQGDVIDDGIEKLPIVGDQQECPGVTPQPRLQPDHGVDVEMVRGLVEEEKIRGCGKRACERCAHPPAAGQVVQHS